MTKKNENAKMTAEERAMMEGFVELNPDPVYYNIDGAEPLLGIVLDRGSFRKRGESEQAHYDVLVLQTFVNGASIDPETGEVRKEAETIERGSIIRLGEKAQVKQYLSKVVRKAAKVLIVPQGKVRTSSGNSCWQFKFYAKPLSSSEVEFARKQGIQFDDLDLR